MLCIFRLSTTRIAFVGMPTSTESISAASIEWSVKSAIAASTAAWIG